jgi:hypothetical protein
LQVIKALNTPHATPTKIDRNASFKKLPMIRNGVAAVKVLSGPEYCMTVLKRIMHTASFVIPSPNTKENSLGYSSYLMIEIAATTSVQHRREHMRRISEMDSSRTEYSLQQVLARQSYLTQ